MAQIVTADIEVYDAATNGQRTLRFATQGYTTGAAPTIAPALDSRITYTRTGAATAFNSSGLLTTVSANTPRLDYYPGTNRPRGLLIETTRTNLFQNSEFAAGVAGTGLVSSSTMAGPAGTTVTAAAFGHDGTTTSFLYTNGVAASTQHAVSVHVRMTDGGAPSFGSSTTTASTNDFALVLAGAAINPTTYVVAHLGGGLYRVSGVATSGAATLGNNGVVKYNTNSNRTFKTTAWQLEAGDCPTSYIPTVGGTGTRNEDIATMATNAPWFNTAEGTLFVDVEPIAQASSGPRYALNIGSGGELVLAGFGPYSGGTARQAFFVVAAGSVNVAVLTFADSYTAGGIARVVGAYKANDFEAACPGFANVVDTAGAAPNIAAGTVYVGGINSLTRLNGWIRRIVYWRTRLTSAQLTAISNGGDLPGVPALDLNFTGDVHVAYEGRIQQPANVQRTAFAPNATMGRSQIGYGAMVLVNNDGGLDNLIDSSYAGRPITVRLGEVYERNNGTPTWTNVLKGTMEQAEFSWKNVTVRVRDKLQDLAKPLQQTRYAGTNDNVTIYLEGTAQDIKGKPKPIVYGQVFNVPLTLVNASLLIYQVSDGAIQSVDAVYDRGFPLTAGAAYLGVGPMLTTAPSINQYRVLIDSTGTYVRLGSNPAGTVTANATQGAAAANRTVAQVWNAILAKAGIPASGISASDITALDAACAYPIGVFCATDRDITALEAADIACSSIGAWYNSDASGIFRIAQLLLPASGASVGTITQTEVISVDRVASRDPGVGVPAWKIKLGYQRIWYVQDDTTANVGATRKAYLANEYRRIEASDSAVLTANLTSPEIEINTVLTVEADASAEASRRLTIYKTRRDMLEVRVRVDAALASVLDLGKIVTLQLNRYGLSAGKKFLIIGIRTDLRQRMFDLTLWG